MGKARERWSWAFLAMLLHAAAPAAAATVSPALATEKYFKTLVNKPTQLRLFLRQMPKGGDLHNHLGGAMYAEDMLGWAGTQGMCLSSEDMRIVPAPCDRPGFVQLKDLGSRDYSLYSKAIDGLSMRGFERGTDASTQAGYDRFFSTFPKFSAALVGNTDKALAAERLDAAENRITYLEIGVPTPALRTLLPKDSGDAQSQSDWENLMDRLAPLLPAAIAATSKDYDAIEARERTILECSGTGAPAACSVVVRYQTAALRTQSPSQVFVSLALGFALAKQDRRFVGVNIVAPEHDPVAVRDYDLHMRMVAYLHRLYPQVAISLHAGELTLGLVPPQALSHHIRDAVLVAGASRIGHGVDISYEDDADALLKEMARRKIDVEINLTSNATILGVKGSEHPLGLYRSAGVPVTLSTDDAGVSRSDLSNEYLRAVREQGLDYIALKEMARNSLAYAFVEGAGLWRDRPGGRLTPPCEGQLSGPGDACSAFLAANSKAQLQWTLERSFTDFERTHH